MASFTRGDYERTFRLALHVYNEQESRDDGLQNLAIEVMDSVEDCIGQISHRPIRSRRKRGWNLRKGISD
jgi:hypothetical protein